ncbi:MAG: hypothetical protein ACMG55_06795 [Microcoleus sp.]
MNRAQEIFSRRVVEPAKQLPKFLMALIFAIGVAAVMTFISVGIYVSSGVSSIDLSRPGFDSLRQHVKNEGNANNFSSTGPLDNQAFDLFTKIYNKQTTELQATGSFSDDAFSDANIGLMTEAPVQ